MILSPTLLEATIWTEISRHVNDDKLRWNLKVLQEKYGYGLPTVQRAKDITGRFQEEVSTDASKGLRIWRDSVSH